MTQENTKRVEIDVLALLHKLWTKKVFILLQPFMSLSLPSWELISSFNQRIRLLHVSMWLTKLMMAKTFLLKICRPVHF